MVYESIDHRNDVIKCSKLCSETTRLRLNAFLLPVTPIAPLRRDRERDDWGRVNLSLFLIWQWKRWLPERGDCRNTFANVLRSDYDRILAPKGNYRVTSTSGSLLIPPVHGKGVKPIMALFSGCCAILTSPKKGEKAVYGYNPALFWVLSVSCWCLAE